MAADTTPAAAPENPFVGLRPFESHESLLFFGREEQTVALLQRLHHHGFVAVVGSSGSGKSSLVRAGLIPKLQAGFLVADRDRWHLAVMKPGDRPRRNLAAAVLSATSGTAGPEEVDALSAAMDGAGARAVLDALEPLLAGTDANLLLVADQFEEVFRFAEREEGGRPGDEALDFVAILLELTRQRELPIYVVMTMRSDFLGDCDAFHGLPEALNRSQYLVPSLTRQQLRTAIVGPARLFGAEISGSLADRILNDAGDLGDRLPVVQHALMRTWQIWKRDGRGLIDHPHYEAAGTLDKALSRHADEALEGMSEGEKRLTEPLFRALTDTDATNRRIRRPVHVRDLEAVTGSGRGEVLGVVERFRSEGRSFLVLTEGREDPLIDISHESLIRQWDRLRHWVDREAADRDGYRRLLDTARRWQRGQASLWRQAELAAALEWWRQGRPSEAWTERYGGDHDLVDRFLEESQAAQEEESRKEEAQRRLRLRKDLMTRFAVTLGALFLAAVGLAIWALRQHQVAESARKDIEGKLTEANQLGAELKVAQSKIDYWRNRYQAEKSSTSSERADHARMAEEARKLEAQLQQQSRVFIQIRDKRQRAHARRVAQGLEGAGYSVPGIELVDVGPQETQLRFFSRADGAEAKKIVTELKALGCDAGLSDTSGKAYKVSEKHFELWYSPSEGLRSETEGEKED